jgi:hypothetical protein
VVLSAPASGSGCCRRVARCNTLAEIRWPNTVDASSALTGRQDLQRMERLLLRPRSCIEGELIRPLVDA